MTSEALDESGLEARRARVRVATLLGITQRELCYLLYCLSDARRYREFEINKRSGGKRTIRAPILPLKRAQASVASWLEPYYKPRPCVLGYVRDRSIQENAARHVGKRWVLRVDLKDFFPSINFGRVRGLLLAPPFSFAAADATIVAQLVCHRNELPQGSPASPLLSNLVCRGLDHALSKLAKFHRCTYTRYCDDLVFSTNRRRFPAALATLDAGTPPVTTLGLELATEITRSGFAVNAEKVWLRAYSQRQIVTGLVTNKQVNVPRQYILDLRTVLFVWKRHGPASAAQWYLTTRDRRNRPPEKALPTFSQIVRGRVQYLGSVRGWNDRIYLRFASELARLDPSFKPTKRVASKPPPSPVLHVYVEGPTDKQHLELALKWLQKKSLFADLQIIIDGKNRGSQQLLKLCRSFCERLQTAPCVFMFDSDEAAIVSQVTDSAGDIKDWSNSVYSFVVPKPPHRLTAERLCIESFYGDADLRRHDERGRRLFFASEFHRPSGRHSAMEAYTTTPNSTSLVLEESVFDFHEQKLSLSKTEDDPLWWTPRKGLLSSEIRQCSKEKHDPIHSRRTQYVA